jgi:aryl-alcohol dehydrogenase-like predicted oxidoreductase
MQNHVNLLYREEEREMLPLCRAEGIGVMPWSPLARGRLARPWDATSARAETDAYGRTLYAQTAEADRQVVEALGSVAARLGAPMAQVALAWLLQKDGVSAPIVGATKLQQLDDAVAALQLKLSPEDVAALEAPYVPHAVAGF